MKKVALVTAFILAAIIAVRASVLPLPAVNGPYLGDTLNNLYAITQAYINDTRHATAQSLSVSQNSGQSNCTQFSNAAIQDIKTSAAGGYACLPTAFSGERITIVNETTQTITLYVSPNDAIAGTTDTVNGGSSYAHPTSGQTTVCAAARDGIWGCQSGS